MSTLAPSLANLVCIGFQYSINNARNLTASQIFNREGNTLRLGLEIATETVLLNILNTTTFPIVATMILPTIEYQNDKQDEKHDDNKNKVGTRAVGGRGGDKRLFHGTRSLRAWETKVEEAVIRNLGGGEETTQLVHDMLLRTKSQKIPTHHVATPVVSTVHQSRLRGRRLEVVVSPEAPVMITTMFDLPTIACPAGTDITNPNVRCAGVVSNVCVLIGPNIDEAASRRIIIDGLAQSFRNGDFVAAIPPQNQR